MWNAHAKDALEERLQYMVCDKQIDLASARRQIATDWIAAYKKYLHADNPCNAIWCHTTRLLFWSIVQRGDDSGAVIPSVAVRLCRIVCVKVFLICRDPVGRNLTLRGCQIDLFVTAHILQPLF